MPYDNADSPNKGLAKAFEGFVFGVTQKMWRRSDGAILWLRNNLIVRVELPAAREHEARLKAEKDQKARASVPQFRRHSYRTVCQKTSSTFQQRTGRSIIPRPEKALLRPAPGERDLITQASPFQVYDR